MTETTAIPPTGTYRVTCGWCGRIAEPPRCGACGRDPELAWTQRGQEAPRATEGRPTQSAEDIRALYDEARATLISAGRTPTVEAIAEQLDRSPRTVRDWRKRYGLG